MKNIINKADGYVAVYAEWYDEIVQDMSEPCGLQLLFLSRWGTRFFINV